MPVDVAQEQRSQGRQLVAGGREGRDDVPVAGPPFQHVLVVPGADHQSGRLVGTLLGQVAREQFRHRGILTVGFLTEPVSDRSRQAPGQAGFRVIVENREPRERFEM